MNFFAAGFLTGLFPGIYIIWLLLLPTPASRVVPDAATQVDIQTLIHIRTEGELLGKRQELIGIIWGEGYLPDKQPYRVVENIQDARIQELNGIEKTDRLEIQMGHGVQSIAYLFNPQPGRPLAIYHQGHDGSFFIGKATIQRFIDQGYMVLVYSMPLLGDNNQPTVHIPNIGPIEFIDHDRFKYLDHPIQYFMEPILEGTNYVQARYQPDRIVMIGYSGGGWSTTLYAALDPRIMISFPTAGSLPIFLRNQNDWGDFEQTYPELYAHIDYLDLYVMGSSGRGRAQMQILNQDDLCCFAGDKHLYYEREIADIASRLGGTFSVFLDDSHKSHFISPIALEKIFNELEPFNSDTSD